MSEGLLSEIHEKHVRVIETGEPFEFEKFDQPGNRNLKVFICKLGKDELAAVFNEINE